MKTLDYTAIGKRVKEARSTKGYTQEKASEKCDIGVSHFGNIERGKAVMSMETLAKVSRALCVSTDYLIFGPESTECGIPAFIIEEVQQKSTQEQYEKYLMLMEKISEVASRL